MLRKAFSCAVFVLLILVEAISGSADKLLKAEIRVKPRIIHRPLLSRGPVCSPDARP